MGELAAAVGPVQATCLLCVGVTRRVSFDVSTEAKMIQPI